VPYPAANHFVPTFLLAGVPKAGTSSLYMYLREHPEVFMPGQKELHFFTSSQLFDHIGGPGDLAALKRVCRSLEDYQSHYRRVRQERAIGDASPSTFYYDDCIPLIKSTLGPDLKIVVSLRDPVSRAYSNYRHLVSEGRETLPFYEALLAEDDRANARWSDFWLYRRQSTYAERLSRFQLEFGASNVVVIIYDDLRTQLHTTLRHLYQHLGVNPAYTPSNLGHVYNQAAFDRPRTVKGRARRTVALTAHRVRTRSYRERLTATAPPIAPDHRSRRFLHDRCREDIQQVEHILGRPLGFWLNDQSD
jgi:hypothetical protein